jgi:hypothetical protein
MVAMAILIVGLLRVPRVGPYHRVWQRVTESVSQSIPTPKITREINLGKN